MAVQKIIETIDDAGKLHLSNILDQHTGLPLTYTETTEITTDIACVPPDYRKYKGKYVKLNIEGALNARSLGIKSDHKSILSLGTDNAPLINDYLAKAKDININIPKGAYYFASPIYIPNGKNINITCEGDLYFAPGIDGVIVESSDGGKTANVEIKGRIVSLNTGNIIDFKGVGFAVKNCYNRTFKIGIIRDFGVGLKVHGINNGSQYNKITFERLVNCKTGILITASGNGWSNQNQYYCGEVRCWNGVEFLHDDVNFDPYNGNIFYGLSFEHCTNRGLILDFGTNNLFFAGRASKSENEAPYLFSFTPEARFNSFFGYSIYESVIEFGVGLNNFIGGIIFSPQGNIISSLTLQGTNINGLFSTSAHGETNNDVASLVKTERKGRQFANVKTNGKRKVVEYTGFYQFVNSAAATLLDPIGYVRVNFNSPVTLTMSADELDFILSGGYKSFYIDNATNSTVKIISSIGGTVLVPDTVIASAGLYQVIYSQGDFRIYKISGLDRNRTGSASGGVAYGDGINHNLTATANDDNLIGHEYNSIFNVGSFLNAKGWDARYNNPIWVSSNLTGKPALLHIQPRFDKTSAVLNIRNRPTYGVDEMHNSLFIGGTKADKDFNRATSALFRWKSGNVSLNDAALILSAAGWNSYTDRYGIDTPTSLSDIITFLMNGQVGIGTNTPQTSSLFEVQSTTKGTLGTRMTTAQRDAIVAPAEGLEIYNLTTKKKQFYNGTAWETITSSVI